MKMFNFLKFHTFEVLGNDVLGAEFLPSQAAGNNQVCLISVRHGRAVTMKIDDLKWINIKHCLLILHSASAMMMY